MERSKATSPVPTVLAIALFCFVFRMVEYLFIRTDRTIIGEAFIHKAIGVVILYAALRRLNLGWSDIGLQRRAAVRHTAYGLLLGAFTFVIAYGAELLIQAAGGQAPRLGIYLTSYAITGNRVMETSALFFAICIAGNILNVIMEEGIFRGLFVRMLEDDMSFAWAMLLASFLFGAWHIAAPLRELVDGNMTLGTAAAFALMQVVMTGLMGIKLCLMVKITGSLWAGMADHFFNNFIVNILHVVTTSGADAMQVIRLSIAQTLSFLIVLLLYWGTGAAKKNTFRQAG